MKISLSCRQPSVRSRHLPPFNSLSFPWLGNSRQMTFTSHDYNSYHDRGLRLKVAIAPAAPCLLKSHNKQKKVVKVADMDTSLIRQPSQYLYRLAQTMLKMRLRQLSEFGRHNTYLVQDLATRRRVTTVRWIMSKRMHSCRVLKSSLRLRLAKTALYGIPAARMISTSRWQS